MVGFLQEPIAGRYEIDGEIGRGGAGRVFRARDLPHQRLVAIKVLRPELAVSPDRFLREILILARLQHPNIMPLFDSGRADDLLYYVMPLIEGRSLRHRLESGSRLTLSEAITITLEVADALSYAHMQGLVHRDVKPENILLSAGHAIVTDFGIARAIERSVDSRTTGPGIAIGTPAYMSPEQASGEHEIDGRSDQYSLGCVLYEMLAGVPAFPNVGEGSLRFAAPRGEAPDVRVARPDVPDVVAMALRRALSASRIDRFEAITSFADALVGGAAGRDTATPAGPLRARAVRFASRAVPQSVRRPAGAIAVALAVIAGAMVVVLLRSARGPAADGSAYDPRRIAVLYFDDHSEDRSLGYLASGLTESLIHELSGVSAVQVVSRNGVKPFRDSAIPVDSVIKVLRVGSLVEGSVQRSNDRVRVTVQLIDARSNSHLASRTFDRSMGELFMLEDDLAHEVASLLRRRIGAEVRVHDTEAATRSTQARELAFRAERIRTEAETQAASHDSLELGRAIRSWRIADSLLAAAERADRRWVEPVVARGWIALSVARHSPAVRRDVAFDSAMAHAARALKHDTASAAALVLRGTALYMQAERRMLDTARVNEYLARAGTDLRGAIARDSTLASAWGALSRVRLAAGDVAGAERDARTALAMDAYLDDARSILLSLFGATLMRDSAAAAWRWCERGAAEFPHDAGFIQCQLTLLAEDMSRRPDARMARRLLAEAERIEPPERARAAGQSWFPIYRQMLTAVVLARAGESDSARAMAARAHVAVDGDPVLEIDYQYEDAFLKLVLGESRATLRLLANYLTARPYLCGLVASHPRWRPLRPDPVFQALTRCVIRP